MAARIAQTVDRIAGGYSLDHSGLSGLGGFGTAGAKSGRRHRVNSLYRFADPWPIWRLPTIISIAEDALYSVPKEYRDGALAIGATQWQTIWRVVLPAARSGIVIAIMLGIGRAIGETMAVMMVTGNAANIPALGPGMFFEPVRTMTATIAAEMGEVANGSMHYQTLFAIGIVLFVITLLINTLAGALVGSQGKRRKGSQV